MWKIELISKQLDLEPGDLIEILYRVWRRDDDGEEIIERWLRAEIIDREPDAWPLARLADGQMTDVRPYMTWRHVTRAHDRRPLAA